MNVTILADTFRESRLNCEFKYWQTCDGDSTHTHSHGKKLKLVHAKSSFY